jgi:insertion element IS1 protein InsB
LPDVRLQLYSDAAARKTACDESAGTAVVCDGQHEFLQHCPDIKGQRRDHYALGEKESVGASRAGNLQRDSGADAGRDVALPQKKTEKLWLWRAYDPIAWRTVAWVLGDRSDASCQKLIDKVGLKGKTFATDDWEGYHRLIPENQLFTGKDLTFPIEQDNSNIRHFLARFRRKTKVVSKSKEMVDLSIRLYHHIHDNPQNLAGLATVSLYIFT